jgi:hypothetical protein
MRRNLIAKWRRETSGKDGIRLTTGFLRWSRNSRGMPRGKLVGSAKNAMFFDDPQVFSRSLIRKQKEGEKLRVFLKGKILGV